MSGHSATKRFYMAASGGVAHENLPYRVSESHQYFTSLQAALEHASQEAIDSRTSVFVYECRPVKKIGSHVKVEDVVEDRSNEARGFRLFGGGEPVAERTSKKVQPIR